MSRLQLNEALPPDDTTFDPEEVTKRICEQFDFPFHAVCRLETADFFDSRCVILSNFVPEAIELLDETGWWDKFDAYADALQSGRPIQFSLEPPAGRGDAEQITRFAEIVQEQAVGEGLMIPLHCSSRLGIACFLGKTIRLSTGDIEAIQITMLAVFQRLCEIRPAPEMKVTRREIECLAWTSRGNTSQEIAAILSISEHTVVRHLASATQKLSAANRGQAVAKAIRLGLME